MRRARERRESGDAVRACRRGARHVAPRGLEGDDSSLGDAHRACAR